MNQDMSGANPDTWALSPPPLPTDDERPTFLTRLIELVLEGASDLHLKQLAWNRWGRAAWWILLLPVATFCWASGLQPGKPRQFGVGLAGLIAAIGIVGLADDERAQADTVAAESLPAVSTSEPSPVPPQESAPTMGRNDTPRSTTPESGISETFPSSSTIPPAPSTTAQDEQSGVDASNALNNAQKRENRQDAGAATTGTPQLPAPTTPPVPASTAPAPTTTTAAPPVQSCHPAYSHCLPHYPGDALNCGDVGTVVTVYDPTFDPYGLDGDADGIGCESYA